MIYLHCLDNYFDNNPAVSAATLTPTKLLLESTAQPDLYMNEINPFDQNLFNTKLNVPMPPSPSQYYQLPQQTAPSPPEEQEEPPNNKKQRKRLLEKNREAAYRCRQKKKRYVHDLEERSKSLEDRNVDLQDQVVKLKEESIYLRNLILTHGNCDCQGMVSLFFSYIVCAFVSNSSIIAILFTSYIGAIIIDIFAFFPRLKFYNFLILIFLILS